MKLKYRLVLVFIFISTTVLEINFHSLHWRSASDGLIYFFGNGPTWDEDLRLKILEHNYLYSTLLLSILLLIFNRKWIIKLILTFVIIHLFVFLPCNYISEHDLDIDF